MKCFSREWSKKAARWRRDRKTSSSFNSLKTESGRPIGDREERREEVRERERGGGRRRASEKHVFEMMEGWKEK